MHEPIMHAMHATRALGREQILDQEKVRSNAIQIVYEYRYMYVYVVYLKCTAESKPQKYGQGNDRHPFGTPILWKHM